MIVPDQKNIKVHFAGTESLDQYGCAREAGVKYHLLTAYPFICKGMDKPDDSKHVSDIPQLIHEQNNHSIMDSGLFTLMFGAESGKKDEAFIDKWYDRLTNFILNCGYEGACVEVDCQKVLGPEKAWELRQRMADKIPNRVINVFHQEDGQKGLDRLIEFSDYIAISVPELRFAGKKQYVPRLASYIKNKKPEIDIHLLGCTEVKMLKQNSFCSSADSTSWKSVVRYGGFQMRDGSQKLYRNVNTDKLLQMYGPSVRKVIKEFGMNEQTDTHFRNYCAMIMQAEQSRLRYQDYAGSQE